MKMGKTLKNFIFWGMVIIIVFTAILIKPLSNLDELWNFNIGKGIADGLIPYKDISMITTPLAGLITGGFLKLFGGSVFVTRVMAVVLAIIILVSIYVICLKLKLPKLLARLLVIAFTMIFLPYFAMDYNFMSIAILLFIIILELINVKKSEEQKGNFKIRNIFIGLFIGLLICTKQNIGLMALIGSIIISCIDKNIKNVFINIGFKIIGVLVPVLALIVYLISTKSLNDFFSYCIWGIKTFENKISYLNLVKSSEIFIKVMSIAIPTLLVLFGIRAIIKIFKEKKKSFSCVMFIYSIVAFSFVFPISDKFHFWIAIVPGLITIFSIAIEFIYKNKHVANFNSKYINEFAEIILILSMVGAVIFILYSQDDNIGSITKYRGITHYENIRITNSLKKEIQEVDNYIINSESKVYILDSSAALYMIPLNRYNKNYDMFNKGNFGKDGEDGIINNLEKYKCKYLILNDNYQKNWQNPDKVTEYVKNNFKLVDSVNKFDVYENK